MRGPKRVLHEPERTYESVLRILELGSLDSVIWQAVWIGRTWALASKILTSQANKKIYGNKRHFCSTGEIESQAPFPHDHLQ